MELKDQVTSLEISKRLKELGVKQDGAFSWVKRFDTEAKAERIFLWQTIPNPYLEDFSAFTVSELGEMLPSHIIIKQPVIVSAEEDEEQEFWYWLSVDKSDDGLWFVNYGDNEEIAPCFKDWDDIQATTEADARGKMLIHLLENGLLSLSK